MTFPIDHDFHIHSQLSTCSSDPEQTTAAILQYGKDNGFSNLCLTDHLWDSAVAGASGWYRPQNIEHVRQALPLPQDDRVRFHFGCETELDRHLTLALAPEHFGLFDFLIIPTTHLHMRGLTLSEEDAAAPLSRRAELYVQRLDAVLHMALPFSKVGIAHLTCPLLAPDRPHDHIDVLNMIGDDVFSELFSRAARVGAGIELNFPIERYEGQDFEDVLRPYRIAKERGCKFYFGSDAHHPKELQIARTRFSKTAEALSLAESDKFFPFAK